MKKTMDISLGGYALVIEEDAYEALNGYIAKLKSSASADVRDELVSDIEERLAELFIERCGKGAVVDLAAVDAVTARIGIPEDEEKASPKTDSLKKRLYRDVDERILGGVLGGFSKWMGIEALPVRLLFVIFCLVAFLSSSVMLHNVGLWTIGFYCILWVLVPASKTVEDKCRAQGKPIRFDDFKARAEAFSGNVSAAAREAGTSPFFKVLGRVFVAAIGIVFLIAGMSVSVTSLVAALSLPWNLTDIPFVAINGHVYDLMSVVVGNSVIAWTAIASLLTLGVFFLYSGVLMAFGLKSPSWHPGLLIFLFWLGVTIACIVLTAKELAMSGLVW